MDLGIKITVLDWEPDDCLFEVVCSNGFYSGGTRIYANTDFFSRISDQLADFPKSVEDKRVVLMGSLEPESAGGGVRLKFFCSTPWGHPFVFVKIRADQNHQFTRKTKATFNIKIEAAAIDEFIKQISVADIQKGDSFFMNGVKENNFGWQKKLISNDKKTLVIIVIATILLPIVFFGAILLFRMSGLPLYFTQLGLYAAFYLLAFWGIKSSGLRLTVAGGQLLWKSLAVVVLSWLVYVLVISVFKFVNLPREAQALGSAPLWKIAANIVSTWFFVGMAEEVLFRGFFLKKLLAFYEERNSTRATLWAVLVSSAFFSLWHLPVRLFSLVNGELSLGMIVVSLAVLFVLGAGFAWLFLRSGSILLTGLVHGVMDFPLIGENSQLSFIILIAAIGLVELARLTRCDQAKTAIF